MIQWHIKHKYSTKMSKKISSGKFPYIRSILGFDELQILTGTIGNFTKNENKGDEIIYWNTYIGICPICFFLHWWSTYSL